MSYTRPHTPELVFNRFFFFSSEKAVPCAPSLLPRRTNAIFICSSSQLLKLPAGTPGYFSPPFQLLNTMPFMPRGENRRSACTGNPTMWRTCSIFCAWSLLLLTDVCAQSQRRYSFYIISKCMWRLYERARCQESLVGCGTVEKQWTGVYLEEYSAVWVAFRQDIWRIGEELYMCKLFAGCR